MTHAAERLRQWLAETHASVAAPATECSGARWGDIALRHRSLTPHWFAAFDRAWAVPVTAPAPAPADVDLVTAAFRDLPPGVDVPPVDPRLLGPRGEVRGLGDSSLRMTWSDGGTRLLAWDGDTGRALQLTAAPPDGYERVSPLRYLAHWVMVRAGGFLLHAAAVGRTRRTGGASGLLLLGSPGHGKSTSTLACLEGGWVTCGDDAVAVLPDNGGWRAAAVYGAVKTKLDSATTAVGPDVLSWDVEGTKRAHLLTATDEALVVPSMRVDGIVLLDPDAHPDGTCEPLTAAAVRSAAVPSTMLGLLSGLLDGDTATLLERLGRMSREVPGVRLPRRSTLARTVADLEDIHTEAEAHISVVLPVYNGEGFVADAVRSILAQQYGRFEVLVVDDASTDGSVEVIEALAEEVRSAGHDLRIIRHDRNRGVAAARNTGIAAASHDLIMFLDQDDLWSERCSSVLSAARRRDDADAAFGRMRYVAIVPESDRGWMRSDWFEGDHRGTVMGAGLFRRSLFDRIGFLPEVNRSGSDDVAWIMRLRDSSAVIVDADEVVLERRQHNDNQSRLAPNMARDLLTIVREHHARTRSAQPAPFGLDVVIPVHGVLDYLRDAVASALDQRGADVRVYVVDDGNEEELAPFVASWADARVRVLRHDASRGIGAARNLGSAAGDQPWLAFLDADDLWPLDRTERLMASLRVDGPPSIAYGSQLVFHGAARVDPAATWAPDASASVPLSGTVLMPRRVFDTVGPFDEDLRVGEFVDWMARARTHGVIEAPVACVSLLRRSHGRNVTATRQADFRDYLEVIARARRRAGE